MMESKGMRGDGTEMFCQGRRGENPREDKIGTETSRLLNYGRCNLASKRACKGQKCTPGFEGKTYPRCKRASKMQVR
jgi:hypothetical protein